MSDIRVITRQDKRVETGPTQFGDEDWPGVFIRGDDAANYAMLLKQVLDSADIQALPFSKQLPYLQLRGLRKLLASAVVGPAREMFEDEETDQAFLDKLISDNNIELHEIPKAQD